MTWESGGPSLETPQCAPPGMRSETYGGARNAGVSDDAGSPIEHEATKQLRRRAARRVFAGEQMNQRALIAACRSRVIWERADPSRRTRRGRVAKVATWAEAMLGLRFEIAVVRCTTGRGVEAGNLVTV